MLGQIRLFEGISPLLSLLLGYEDGTKASSSTAPNYEAGGLRRLRFGEASHHREEDGKISSLGYPLGT